MNAMKKLNNYLEVNYREFEIRILQNLIPDHIPTKQWKLYLEKKFDKNMSGMQKKVYDIREV